MIPPTAHSLRRIVLAGQGAEGLLVIDHPVGGRCFGGLRIVPDLDEAELVASARTMTLKYAFAGLAMGGAKAALRLPPGADPELRRRALTGLGAAWHDEITTGFWTPAIDMGVDLDDIRVLLSGAKVDLDLRHWRACSHEYTAWSVMAALQVACSFAGVTLKGARVLIEGYGRVGGALGRLLAEQEARVVGVSTRVGAFIVPNGVDLEQLERLRIAHGDNCVAMLAGAIEIAPQDLLLSDAEIAIPCARAGAVDAAGAARMPARVVICAANAALSREVERQLHQRGKLVVPDFVANGGGVVGSVLEKYARPQTIRAIIQRQLARRVGVLLAEAQAEGFALVDRAEQHALRVLNQAEVGTRRWPSAWSLKGLRRVPWPVREAVACVYARARLYPA